jgi:hypothetical protein
VEDLAMRFFYFVIGAVFAIAAKTAFDRRRERLEALPRRRPADVHPNGNVSAEEEITGPLSEI